MNDKEYKFNDDLLANDNDANWAKGRFPLVAFALVFPNLIAEFNRIDPDANRLKDEARHWGLIAVGLVTASLMAAAAEPVLPEWEWLKVIIAILAALAGLAGASIGVFGIRFGKRKDQWLEHRLLTERLRQLHFQILVGLAPLIVEAATDPIKRTQFETEREGRLKWFQDNYVRDTSVWWDNTLGDPDVKYCALVDPSPITLNASDPAAVQLVQALEELRLDHQIKFATNKISEKPPTKRFWSWPRMQTIFFGRLGTLTVGGLILLDLIMIGVTISGAFSGADAHAVTTTADVHAASHAPVAAEPHGAEAGADPHAAATWVHVLTIWTAIAALALRVVEEGLRSHAETERYRQYKSALAQVRARFKKTGATLPDKLAALGQLEEVSYREMIEFLDANKEARFVM